MSLHNKKCLPCHKGDQPLSPEEIKQNITILNENWQVIDQHHLERTFMFKNFEQALRFTNLVGKVAEEEQHHPDILLSWGKVKITLWTHAVNGLSINDFILADKCESLYSTTSSLQ